MTNPILGMLNNKHAQQGSTPNPAINGLPQSLDDPRMAQTKALVNQYGGDPKKAASALCQQMGLTVPSNPMQLIQQILSKGRG